MNKHAYLVMCHNNFYTLEKLLLLLDNERNDIFLHIDKKAKNFDMEKFKNLLKYSKVYFIPNMNVKWASPSQIKCELNLFKFALKTGKYSYYHLISGVDLPLKKVDDIHSFFEINKGKEFIGFCEVFDTTKIKQINLFNSMGRKNSIINSLKYLIRKLFIKFQIYLKYDYTKKFNMVIKKGTNWVSVTEDFVKYLISNESLIKKMFRYSISGDEFYKQTLIWNSSFRENIYNINNEYNGCMRLIDWNRGSPYTFRKKDFKLLTNSDKLFARKFDQNVDKSIIDMIYNKLGKGEKYEEKYINCS